jgi:hypothetical protein
VLLLVDEFGGTVRVGSAQTGRDVDAGEDWRGRKGSEGRVSMQGDGDAEGEGGEKVAVMGMASSPRTSMFLIERDRDICVLSFRSCVAPPFAFRLSRSSVFGFRFWFLDHVMIHSMILLDRLCSLIPSHT